MEPILTYHLTDGQQLYIFDDWGIMLEHIRQGFLSTIHPPQDGDDYYIEVKTMSRADYDAIPEQ